MWPEIKCHDPTTISGVFWKFHNDNCNRVPQYYKRTDEHTPPKTIQYPGRCSKRQRYGHSLESGRPRSGPIFQQRNRDKREYWAAIRRNEANSVERYSNDLHEALLRKRGDQFWKCWNSKLESKSGRPISINGQSDPSKIEKLFAEHFSKTCDLPHCWGLQPT